MTNPLSSSVRQVLDDVYEEVNWAYLAKTISVNHARVCRANENQRFASHLLPGLVYVQGRNATLMMTAIRMKNSIGESSLCCFFLYL